MPQPHKREPSPDTSLQLGLPGSGEDKSKKRKSQGGFLKPEPHTLTYVNRAGGTRHADSPLNKFAQNIEHYNELLTTRRDRLSFGYGNRVRTNLRSKNYYGQVDKLPVDSAGKGSSKGSGSPNTELSLFLQKETNPPEEPYHKVYPSSSRSQQTNKTKTNNTKTNKNNNNKPKTNQ